MILLLIVSGSKVVYKDNFATIIGSMQISGKKGENIFNTANIVIDFPDGFDRNNSVVIAFGSKTDVDLGYTFGSLHSDNNLNFALQYASGIKAVTLGGKKSEQVNKLQIKGCNYSTDTVTFYYKIILMKFALTEEEDYILGDLNGDGIINEEDSKIMKDYIQNEGILTEKQFAAADINKDGKITLTDLSLIQKMIDK